MIEKKLETALHFIREKTSFVPEVAVTLGSGLGKYANEIKDGFSINYSDIPGMPVTTAPGHEGRFVFGTVSGVKVAVMQGRIHYYEGREPEEAVMPLRLLKLMGAKILLLTNSAGGINPDFKPGDFMLVEDHISFLVPSPLRGKNPDFLGPRFPDMSNIYDKELRKLIVKKAEELQVPLKQGVYLQLTGPAYESPAEVRMCRLLGADAVGMSTACEAAAANHMGMKICGISCISNLACGMTEQNTV